MEILSANAEQKLANIASSIGRNPMSWNGWYSLVIQAHSENENLQQECLFWSQSIIDAYLQGIEGRTYFCSQHGIHILCKGIGIDVLEQTGQQICSLVYSESSLDTSYNIYDLSADGFAYMDLVLENTSTLFSHPEKKQNFLQNCRDSLMSYDAVKPALDGHDMTKVLLVEDDPVTRWMVRHALKDQCHLATAASGNKAFSMYQALQPDVVFLDIHLQDKNGYDVLSWIMRNDPGACVVMFSSHDSLDNIANAFDDGASGFIAKPFLKESLLHYVHSSTH